MEETTPAVFRRMSHNQGSLPNIAPSSVTSRLELKRVVGGGELAVDFGHEEMMWYSAGPKAHTVLIMKSSALFDAKHARSAPENQADPMSGLTYFVPLGHKGTLLSLAQWRVVELPTLCMRRWRWEKWHLLMQESSFYFHQMFFWLITLHWSMTAPHFASDTKLLTFVTCVSVDLCDKRGSGL